MSQTRNKNKKFGLNLGITESDQHILGNKLPTKEQVLRCFMYHHKDGKGDSKKISAQKVYEQILPHFEKGGILMKHEKSCKENIIALYDKGYVKKVLKIPKERRESEYALNKIKEFEDELHHTMPLWHENALNTCDNEEDRDFLLCMMGTHPTIKYREASYSTKDVKTAKKFEKYEARKAKEKQYIQKQKEKSSVEDRVLQSDNEDSDVVVSLIT